MNHKVAFHCIILILSICAIFFWIADPHLSYYSLQLAAVMMITLILSRRFLPQNPFYLLESTISTMATLLITSSTGGLSSPFFFLNFILLFELSFLLEPTIPIITSLTLIFFYLYSFQTNSTLPSLVSLFSLPLMTPLAYFFGKIYQKVKYQKQEIHALSQKVENLEEELLTEELQNDPLAPI